MLHTDEARDGFLCASHALGEVTPGDDQERVTRDFSVVVKAEGLPEISPESLLPTFLKGELQGFVVGLNRKRHRRVSIFVQALTKRSHSLVDAHASRPFRFSLLDPLHVARAGSRWGSAPDAARPSFSVVTPAGEKHD
jgi:hypothetical protein